MLSFSFSFFSFAIGAVIIFSVWWSGHPEGGFIRRVTASPSRPRFSTPVTRGAGDAARRQRSIVCPRYRVAFYVYRAVSAFGGRGYSTCIANIVGAASLLLDQSEHIIADNLHESSGKGTRGGGG